MTKEQIQAKIQAKRERLDAIKALSDEEYTDEVRNERIAIVDDIKKMNKDLKLIEEEEGLYDSLDQVVEPKPKTQPKEGEFKDSAKIENNEEIYNSDGEFLQDVATAADVNASGEKRTLAFKRLHAQNAATGLGESVPSDGGFLVRPTFAEQLLKRVHETGILIPRCTKIPIAGNSNRVLINGVDETSRANGSRWGGVQTYWEGEGDEITSSKPKFRQIELKLNKLTGLCYATDELLADAAALESVTGQAFTEEFKFKFDDAVIRGTGAGQPLGVLNSNCKVRVGKESGQAATTLVAENVEKMYARMEPRSLPNAVWLINQEVWPQIFKLHHEVGTGGAPMYMEPGKISEAPNGTLLGKPILPIEQCAALGTEGDIMFVDLSKMLWAEKGGIQAASSMHVMFKYDEMCYRFIIRVDGQPMYSAPLTPYKGTSSTLSPFVTLQARS